MRVILDATNERMYPIASFQGRMTSGMVQLVRHVAAGLAERGHTVHVIAGDAETEEQRGPNLWYWGPENHPRKADVAVQLMHVNPDAGYDAEVLVLVPLSDPHLGPDHHWAQQVDGFALFSETHGRILRQMRPTVPEDKCFVVGLGVELEDYGYIGPKTHKLKGRPTVPGRLLYANDPARGLFAALDVFDRVKERVPDATLHVAYDFERGLAAHAWEHSQMAQMLWECKRRMETTPGVVSLGALSRAEVVKEQLECQVHCMPSDTPNHDQLHGLTQMECAAAGCALVLSDTDAFPEVFGEGAEILPVIGKYLPNLERRVDAADYAEVVVELMADEDKWREASRKARALAEKNTWGHVVEKWEKMLLTLKEGVKVG